MSNKPLKPNQTVPTRLLLTLNPKQTHFGSDEVSKENRLNTLSFKLSVWFLQTFLPQVLNEVLKSALFWELPQTLYLYINYCTIVIIYCIWWKECPGSIWKRAVKLFFSAGTWSRGVCCGVHSSGWIKPTHLLSVHIVFPAVGLGKALHSLL